MSIVKRIQKGKYHLLFAVVPPTLLVASIKVSFHFLDWEPLPKDLISFFPSVFTGIVFLLGFILAGLLSDYKESEKIPNDLCSSLYIMWHEAEIAWKNTGAPAARSVLDRLRGFVPMFKNDFLIHRKESIFQLVDSFTEDFAVMDKQTVPQFMSRLRNEQANLTRLLNRINVIKETSFAPSVFTAVQAISVIFLVFSFLLAVEPWWGGVLLIYFFTLVFSSLIFLIKDIDDPFDYTEDGHSSDEVSLAVLERFHRTIEARVLD
jgi:hypothetical protein